MLFRSLVVWVETDLIHVAVPLGPAFLSILGIILGLLLVFRTNTAYDRWWEGRRLWGQLVNVSRGAVVVQADLVDALARGHLGGAVLDVYEAQPLPADSPLLGFDHVLLTPHMAGITADSMRRMGLLAVSQTLDLLAGRRPPHLVNPEVWPHRRRSPFTTNPEPA